MGETELLLMVYKICEDFDEYLLSKEDKDPALEDIFNRLTAVCGYGVARTVQTKG